MIALLQSLLDRPGLLGYIPVVLVLAHFGFKEWRGLVQFHNEHLSRRHLERLKELGTCTAEGSLPNLFLKKALGAEMFNLATGIKTSPNKSFALMALYSAGDLKIRELKGLEQYAELSEAGTVTITIPTEAKVFAWFSFILGLAIFLDSVAGLVSMTKDRELIPSLFGFGILFGGFVIAMLISVDFRRYGKAKTLQAKLLGDPIEVSGEPKATQ